MKKVFLALSLILLGLVLSAVLKNPLPYIGGSALAIGILATIRK